MSNFIDLNSQYRDINTYPNPCNYTVEDNQVAAWCKAPRQVNAMSNRPGYKAIEFQQTVRVQKFILPYVDVTYSVPTVPVPTIITENTANFQRLYLDVHNPRLNDRGLISTIGSVLDNARFVLTFSHVQVDNVGNPRWVHYNTHQDQAMRFSRNDPIVINIMQEQGYTINIADTNPPDLTLQTWILLDVTPYFRDGEYNNNGIGLTQF